MPYFATWRSSSAKRFHPRSMRVFENRFGSSTRGGPDIFSRIKIVPISIKTDRGGKNAREKKEEEEEGKRMERMEKSSSYWYELFG